MTQLSGFGGFYSGKRVLVTGHTGFKGSWLTSWLLGLGAEVAGYSIDIPSQPSHFELLKLAGRISHEFGDVRDAEHLSKFVRGFRPEVIFHLAAQPLVRASYEFPVQTFDTNVMGTVNVLEAARATPAVNVLINVTSDKCYENLETGQAYRESDRLGGKDPYSASKACAELVFSSYFQSFFKDHGQIKMASARAGNVIGGGDWALDRIVPDCFRAWSRGGKVTTRNPQSVRPWQHVLEPLSGYLWLAARLGSEAKLNGEAFNFGPLDGSNQNVERLLAEFKKNQETARWEVDANADRSKKEAGLLNLSTEKAAEMLQWQATLSFEEAVALTSEWYRSYYANEKLELLTSKQITQYTNLAGARKRVWVC
jgi:CDP-glucose 4,6-dehydratase